MQEHYVQKIPNERMPVKTALRKEDLPNILSKYSLGEIKQSKTFAHGAGQTTLLIEMELGRFVLRYYENRTAKHVLFELRLFEYLHDKGYPVPKVIRSASDNLLEEYKGKPLAMLEFIEGEHGEDPNDVLEGKQIAQVVKTVAELHELTLGYAADYLHDREPYDAAYCLKTFEDKSDSKDRHDWLRKELASLEIPAGLPKGVCHADLNYGNFLLKDGKVAAVLDFDMSFYGDVVYDVASLIYWWAWPPKSGLKIEDAKRIVQEYQKHRPLTDAEKISIFDYLKLIILLGISWSSAEDFDAEKERIEKLNQLGRADFTQEIVDSTSM